MTRRRNGGLRKVCACARTKWAKCAHPWHMNHKVRGGPSYRLSLDRGLGRHIAGKTEAAKEAGIIRAAIDAGTFRRRSESGAQAVPAQTKPDGVTLESFGATYFARQGKPPSANSQTCFRQLVAFELDGAPFGQKALGAITEDDLEAVMAKLRAAGKAASTRNKYVQVLKAMFRWATRKGYLQRNPAGESDGLRREQHARRDRRLEPGEEVRLLQHAVPHLQRLIIAALETGCRKGELLSLTWADVSLERREMTIRAERTKTRTGRVIPLSARVVAALTMATADAAGEPFGPDAFVFGDAVGRRVLDVKRAWETCVLKAHGHVPQWTRGHALSDASREAFRETNLTFHDLRHEAGSRLLEAGWPIHNVAHMLGHANISQTSTYLNATRIGLQEAMRRLDDARCNPVANDGATDLAPLRNRVPADTAQHLVN